MLDVIRVIWFLSQNLIPSFRSPIITGIFLLPAVFVSDGISEFGITLTGTIVDPAQSLSCIGFAGSGWRRYLPSLSFNVSSHCNPSSFVTIAEVGLNACPSVIFNAFLISSRSFIAVTSFVEICSRIILFLVTLDSSAIHVVKAPVIFASVSARSSFVQGKYPAYFSISYEILSNCGVVPAVIFPPSPTFANPVCCARFLYVLWPLFVVTFSTSTRLIRENFASL